MMVGAQVMGFISMMPSLLLPDPLMGLAQLEMLLHARRNLLLSWVKRHMRQPEDGQVHQMVLMLGDIALSGDSTRLSIALHQPNIHALLAKRITVEDLLNLLTTTTTLKRVKQSEWI